MRLWSLVQLHNPDQALLFLQVEVVVRVAKRLSQVLDKASFLFFASVSLSLKKTHQFLKVYPVQV